MRPHRLKQNGATVAEVWNDTDRGRFLPTILALTSGDYLELEIVEFSSNITADGGQRFSEFSMVRVGEEEPKHRTGVAMTIEDLSARLEKVERQNRRMRSWGGATLILSVSAMAMGQAVGAEKVIRAQKFEAVNARGEVKATLEVTPEGFPMLYLEEETNQATVMLFAGAGRASVAVKAKAGNGGASIFTTPEGGKGFCVIDKDAKYLANVGTLSEGRIGLKFNDPDSKGGLILSTKGEPELALVDKAGKNRAEFKLDSSNQCPVIRFSDDAGKGRIAMGVDNLGGCGLVLRSKDEKSSMGISVYPDTTAAISLSRGDLVKSSYVLNEFGLAGLYFFDKDGKVIEQLPR